MWQAFRFTVPAAWEDLLCDWVAELTGRGASVVSAGPRAQVTAYLPASEPAAKLLNELTRRWDSLPDRPSLPQLQVEQEELREEDWAEAWKAYFHPLRIGRRLVIKPSWEPWPPPDEPEAARPDDLLLELDPGMAFGTGAHETTRLCLEALERFVTPGARVADLGCGSGILALAAARLGAGYVEAWEVDPQALDRARENCLRNDLDSVCRLCLGDALRDVLGRFDLIAANLNTYLLLELIPDLGARLTPGGRALLSGTTESSLPALREALARGRLTLEETHLRGEWALLVAGVQQENAPTEANLSSDPNVLGMTENREGASL